MWAHRQAPGADTAVPTFQEPAWSLSRPGRRWPWRVRILARLLAPWLDLALASGADPSGSPQLERRAAHLLSHLNRVRIVGTLRERRRSADARVDPRDPCVPVDPEEVRLAERQLVELEELLIGTAPVYCRGVAMATQLLSEGTGPLFAPQRRGELRDRVAAVLAALRGAS